MKKIFLILCTSFALFGCLRAQLLGGIFSQKSSDLKSLAKQIALLQVYIGWVEKGYAIAHQGLTAIGEIKNGEFNLHSVFFNSLSAVNPEIRKYSKVGIIISDEIFIAGHFKKILAIDHLTPAEADFVRTVYSNTIDACSDALSDLIDVLSDNNYQMHDDERIQRIDGIYADMEGQVALTKRFTSEVQILSGQRMTEENDIDFLEKMEE